MEGGGGGGEEGGGVELVGSVDSAAAQRCRRRPPRTRSVARRTTVRQSMREVCDCGVRKQRAAAHAHAVRLELQQDPECARAWVVLQAPMATGRRRQAGHADFGAGAENGASWRPGVVYLQSRPPAPAEAVAKARARITARSETMVIAGGGWWACGAWSRGWSCGVTVVSTIWKKAT